MLADRAELAARLRAMGSTWWEAHAEKLLFEEPRAYNSLALKHKKLSGGTEEEKEAFIFYCLGLGFPGVVSFGMSVPHVACKVSLNAYQRRLEAVSGPDGRWGCIMACSSRCAACKSAPATCLPELRALRSSQHKCCTNVKEHRQQSNRSVLRRAGEGLALMLPEKTIYIVDEGAEVTKIEKWFPNELVFDKWFERSGYSDLVKAGTNKAQHLYALLEDGATYHAMSNSRVRLQSITAGTRSKRIDGNDNEGTNSGPGGSSRGGGQGDGAGEPHEASAAPALAAVAASAAAEWDKVATRGAALLRRIWAAIASAIAALAAFWAHAVGALVETAAPQPVRAQQPGSQAPAASVPATPAPHALHACCGSRVRLQPLRPFARGMGGAWCALQLGRLANGQGEMQIQRRAQGQTVRSGRVKLHFCATRRCSQTCPVRKLIL